MTAHQIDRLDLTNGKLIVLDNWYNGRCIAVLTKIVDE
jgi:hypothetical protein